VPGCSSRVRFMLGALRSPAILVRVLVRLGAPEWRIGCAAASRAAANSRHGWPSCAFFPEEPSIVGLSPAGEKGWCRSRSAVRLAARIAGPLTCWTPWMPMNRGGGRHWRWRPRVCRSMVRRRHHRDDEAGEHWSTARFGRWSSAGRRALASSASSWRRIARVGPVQHQPTSAANGVW